MRHGVLGLVLVLGSSAVGLWADAAAGRADYLAGQRFQAARRWGPAAQQYLKALKDDPQAYGCYRALGTLYYEAGDRHGALAYYDRYLALNPGDTATRAFADALRAQLGGRSATVAAPAAARPAPSGGFSLRLDAAAVMNDGSDVASLYQASPPGGLGAAVGVGLDYALADGLVGGLDLVYGPLRTYNVNIIGYGITQKWAISNFMVGVNPGWRFKLAHHWLVEPRLELGYMASSTTLTDNVGDPAATLSAGGFEAWPQLRGEYVFGHWGIGASLGYLWAMLSPVTSDQNTQPIPNPSGSGNWVMNNGGLSMGFFGAYHFNLPF